MLRMKGYKLEGYRIAIDEKDIENPTSLRVHLMHRLYIGKREVWEEIYRPSGKCFRTSSDAKLAALDHYFREQQKAA